MVTRQIYDDKHWPLACSENVCVYATVSDTCILEEGVQDINRRKNTGNYLGMVCCELICLRLVLSPSSYCQNSDFLWFVDSLTDINPCSLDCTHGIFDQNRQHILLSTQLNRGFGSTGRVFFSYAHDIVFWKDKSQTIRRDQIVCVTGPDQRVDCVHDPRTTCVSV